MQFWSEKNTENGSQNGPPKHLKWRKNKPKKRDKKQELKSDQKRVKNKSATPEPGGNRDHFPLPNLPPYNSQSSNRNIRNGPRSNALPVILQKAIQKSIKKNDAILEWKKHRKWEPKWIPKAPKMNQKTFPKTRQKKELKSDQKRVKNKSATWEPVST